MEKKYRALRVLTWIFRIVGVLVLIAGIVLGGLFAVTPTFTFDYSNLDGVQIIEGPPATGVGLGIIALGVLFGLTIYAFGELLHIFIDVEENTRQSMIVPRRLYRLLSTDEAENKLRL